MNTLLEQLEEAKRLDDQGMIALISAQLFYLRNKQDMPVQVEKYVPSQDNRGKRAALLEKFGVKKQEA